MREYKREKELKRAVVVPLTLVFSLLCVSTALAAGNRAADIYESIYVETDNAVKNEEFNTSVQNYLEEHTQEPGLDDGIEIIDLEGEIAPRASYNINWKVPSSSRTQSASFTKSSGTIYVAANLSRSGRIGIIEPSGAMRYVTGSGEVSHTFVVYQSGLHRVFVENTSSSSSLTAIGYYTN